MEEEARHLEEWLQQGFFGEMRYMENHFEKRIDPTKLVPGAKSVVVLMHTRLRDSMASYLQGGGRKIDTWFQQHKFTLTLYYGSSRE